MPMSFGAYLREIIEKGGYSVRSISTYLKVDRSTLYQYFGDKCVPPADFLVRLSAFLRLTHTEEQELFRAYRRLCEGKWAPVFDAIDRHLALLKRLDTPAGALEMQPSMRKQDYTRAEGAYLVEDLLWQALSSGRAVDVCLFFPLNDTPIGRRISAWLSMTRRLQRSQPVRVTHLSPCPRHDEEDGAPCEALLRFLESTLELMMASSGPLDYTQTYYYTGSDLSDFPGLIFPYYLLLEDKVLLLSRDGERAYLMQDEALAGAYRQEFLLAAQHAHPFRFCQSDPSNLLAYYDQTVLEPVKPRLNLHSQPFLTLVLTSDIVARYIARDNPCREQLVQLCNTYYVDHLTVQSDDLFFFTRTGLEEFVREGYVCGFSAQLASALEVPDRLALMERYLALVEAHPHRFFLIREEYMAVPASISVYVDGSQLLLTDHVFRNGYQYLSVTDPSLVTAYHRYLSSLPRSEKVYPWPECRQALLNAIATLKTMG